MGCPRAKTLSTDDLLPYLQCPLCSSPFLSVFFCPSIPRPYLYRLVLHSKVLTPLCCAVFLCMFHSVFCRYLCRVFFALISIIRTQFVLRQHIFKKQLDGLWVQYMCYLLCFLCYCCLFFVLNTLDKKTHFATTWTLIHTHNEALEWTISCKLNMVRTEKLHKALLAIRTDLI